MKKIFVLFVSILLIVAILGIGFVFSEPLPEGSELGFDVAGELETNSLGGGILQFFFGSASEEGSNLFQISDNIFEGVIPNVGKDKSFLNVDSDGKVLGADLFVGDEGGKFLINGAKFEVEPNTRFRYNPDKGYLLPDNSKIFSIGDPLTITGENILFGDELILNGKALLTGNSYLIQGGEATLRKSNIKVSAIDGSVKIFRGDSAGSVIPIYSGNYVWEKSDGIEIKSSKNGNFGVDFLQGNGILDVRNNAHLAVEVGGGDGFEVNRFLGMNNFVYNPSDEGDSIFNNGPNIIHLFGDWATINSNLELDSIIDGEYLTVPALLSTGTEEDSSRYRFGKDSWRFNILGDKENIQINKGFLEDYDKNSNFLTYENTRIKYLLDSGIGDTGLKEIAFSLKENSGDGGQDIFDYSVPYFLDDLSSKNFDFTETQKVNLIKETSSLTGNLAGEVLSIMTPSLRNFESEGHQSEKIYDYYLGVLNMLGDEIPEVNSLVSDEDYNKASPFLSKLNFACWDILSEAISEDKSSDFSLSYLDKAFNSDVYGEDTLYQYFGLAFDDYNGNNFNDIERGINVLGRYGDNLYMAESLDLDISNIKDKESFANEYVLKLNEKVSEMRPGMAREIADDLNNIHDIEWGLGSSDIIRQSISEDLSFESRYFLISHNLGSEDIYPSTFDLISENIPDNFPDIVQEIDPEGVYSTAFTLELARRNKLDDILYKDPDFFVNSLKDGFNNGEYVSVKSDVFRDDFRDDFSGDIYSNGVFSVDAVNEIWSNPEYRAEKIELEKFFYEKHGSAKSKEEENFYAFFLGMNENPLMDSTNEIKNMYPEVNLAREISSSIPVKETISAKLYFEDDESSYQISKNFYGDRMNLVKSYTQKGGDENEVSIYRLNVGGKTVELNLELGNAGESFSNSQEVLEGDTFDVVALRSHCYHQNDVLDSDFNILNNKIIFNGGCWSSTQLPILQKQFPNMQFVVETDKGHGYDSDPAILEILNAIAQGESNWEDISDSIPEGTGLSFPNSPNQVLYNYVQIE